MRVIIERRLEWGYPTVLTKLDIAKAYDSVDWMAIAWMLERRQLLAHLRSADSLMHQERLLKSRIGDGIAQFELQLRRDMPQGAPESPLVFAALKEDIVQVAKATTVVNELPCGLTRIAVS